MESRNLKLDAALGVMIIGVIALFIWLSVSLGGNAPKGAKKYVMFFDSALGLHKENDVAIAGVLVGTIEKISIKGRLAKVDVAIGPDVKLFENARAAVRAKSLLGEKYVDLDPGTSDKALLKEGALLSNNVPTVEIDEVIREIKELVSTLNVIAPPFEKAVGEMQRFLGEGEGKELSTEMIATVRDAGSLIRETSEVVEASGEDFKKVLTLLSARGPRIITNLDNAGERFDKILAGIDPKGFETLSKSIGPVSKDMRSAMQDIKHASQELETLLSRVDKNLARLDQLNERAIREFLQVEGVRVNLIPDVNVQRRVRRLRNEADPLSVAP